MVAKSSLGQFVRNNLTGLRHGKVTAVRPTDRRAKDQSAIWVMRCDCGREFERTAAKFRKSITCGCGMQDNAGQFDAVSWAGRTIQDCTPLYPTAERSHGYVIWAVRCDLCGEAFARPSSAMARRSLSHNCRQWWLKYKANTHRGRPPIPESGSHINSIYKNYEGSARVRGIRFGLTKEQVVGIITQACHYCGRAPIDRKNGPNLSGTFAWTGIDRVDPEGDYEVNNCVPCCPRCNFAKGTMNGDEFREWVRAVHAHFARH